MSIGKKNKNHLKGHGGVKLIAPILAPMSDDPLKFWTGHPTENIHVDLNSFAQGELENPRPFGKGYWAGPFTGRPQLVAELAPALQARFTLASSHTVGSYLTALRAWWRFFDSIENTSAADGRRLACVESVADLNELHEAAARRSGMNAFYFNYILSIFNAARKLHKPRLSELPWELIKYGEPTRILVPDDQARAIKTVVKQDWERVRRTWARNDSLCVESQRRSAYAADPGGATDRGEIPSELSEEEELLLKNLRHFQYIQQNTGRILPTSEQLRDGEERVSFWESGLELRLMRALLFTTVEEADIAIHLALIGSGWNPSTMANLDGSSPSLVFDHPKDVLQTVLSGDDDEEAIIQADKPRAGGKTQYCIGLKKHKSSPPVIVATYLKRVEPLREQLKSDYQAATAELARLQTDKADNEAITQQFKMVQKLRQGLRSVWLYVDLKGRINWLDIKNWKRYGTAGKQTSYLENVCGRLNADCARRGEPPIGKITPSDFRDIYARWVYAQTGGNILAVMLALGHSSLASTGRYLENNLFSAENDESTRRFMTHLFVELKQGRVDLTILAQLVRHGPLTTEMEERLEEYRKLMRSRVGVACADPRHPPAHIAQKHQEGRLCSTQLCLHDCGNAKFLPESLDGIAMRVEELYAISERLPRETWLRSEFQKELDGGESLLDSLYPRELVSEARGNWRDRIVRGEHLVPGLGLIADVEGEIA